MTTEVILLTKGQDPICFKYERLKALETILRGRTADVIVSFGSVSEELRRIFKYVTVINDGEVVLRG